MFTRLIVSFANLLFALAAFLSMYFIESTLLTGSLLVASGFLLMLSVYNMSKLGSFGFYFVACYFSLFYIAPIGELFILVVDYNKYQFLYFLITIPAIHFFMFSYSAIGYADCKSRVFYVQEYKLKFFLRLSLFIYFLFIFFVIYNSGGISRLVNISRAEFKEDGGYFALLGTYLNYMLAPAFSLLAIYLRSSVIKSKIILLISLVVFCEFVLFLFFKARTSLLLHSSAFILGWYYLSEKIILINEDGPKYLEKANKLAFISLILLLVLSLVIARFARGSIGTEAEFNFDSRVFFEKTINSGDLGYYPVVVEVLEQAENAGIALEGQSYYRLGLSFFPRSIFGEDVKPPSTQRIVGSLLRPKVDNMTIPPGINGDAYLNFSEFGVMLFIVFGFFFGLLDRKAQSLQNLILYCSSFPLVFHFTRGAFVNPILVFIILFFCVFFISRFIAYSDKVYSLNKLRTTKHE